MAKIRIYNLAKKMNIKTEELINKLKTLGIQINNHFSSVDDCIINDLFPNLVKNTNSFFDKELANLEICDKKLEIKDSKQKILNKNTNMKILKKKTIEISGELSLKELSHKISFKYNDFFFFLKKNKIILKDIKNIDIETSSKILNLLGYSVKNCSFNEKAILDKREIDKNSKIKNIKSIIVAVMGHVDHGKTSLLKNIEGIIFDDNFEHRGITQNITFYYLKKQDFEIYFLDTPGHEIFFDMRKKGAKFADIILLVIAINDGIMPQTKDVINYAKEQNIPLLIVLNKIDLLEYNEDKVINQLLDNGLVPENLGGSVQIFKVSALKKIGLEELIEGLIVQYELICLEEKKDCAYNGIVIDVKFIKGLGFFSSVLFKFGKLFIGDYFICGNTKGRVKLLRDISNNYLQEVSSKSIVYVLGFENIPLSCEIFNIVSNKKDCEKIFSNRNKEKKHKELNETSKLSIEDFNNPIISKKINIILKSDSICSAESIILFFKSIRDNDHSFNIIKYGIGNINEADIDLSITTKSHIFGFNVEVEQFSSLNFKKNCVNIFIFNIIYDLIDYINTKFLKKANITPSDVILGFAEVRQIFAFKKNSTIAGCYVIKGKIFKDSNIIIKRKNSVIFTGSILSLKKFKEDVKEVSQGHECGIIINNFISFEKNDIIECYLKK